MTKDVEVPLLLAMQFLKTNILLYTEAYYCFFSTTPYLKIQFIFCIVVTLHTKSDAFLSEMLYPSNSFNSEHTLQN